MKKNILLVLFLVFAISASTIFISDGLTYLVASIMALTIIGGIHANKKPVLKLTRWAKANPKSAQIFISVIQIVLLSLAIITGFNLKELGYEFSNITAYIFTAFMVLGFAYIPFLPKRSNIAIPNQVNKNRFAYLSISLSAVILMAFTGNRIGDIYPNSPVTQTLEKIDRTIFGEDISPMMELEETQVGQIQTKDYHGYLAASSAKPLLAAVDIRSKDEVKKSSRSNTKVKKNSRKSRREIRKANKKARKELRQLKRQNRKNLRRAAAGGSCVAAVFLIILLVITFCAGICLTIFGIAAITSAGEIAIGILFLGLGPVIVWGSVEGIRRVRKWCGKG